MVAGEIIQLASGVTPSGYAQAAGQILSIQQNPELFAAIGTLYGGNGTTTFALPDLRGRSIIGDSATTTPGQVVGSAEVVLTPATTPTSAGGQGGPIANGQPAVVMTYLIALQGVFPPFGEPYGSSLDKYVGEIFVYAGDLTNKPVPVGYAIADGRMLQISQNTALFALIGTTYGGDGRTTFALPDLRGRLAIDDGQTNDGQIIELGQKSGTLDLLAPIVTAPANGATVADVTPLITGTAEANRTVVVVVDGAEVGVTSSNALGNWSLEVRTPLSQSPHVVSAYITDGAGSASPRSSTQTIQIDIDDVPVFDGLGAVLPGGTEDARYTVTKDQLLQGYSDPDGKPLSVIGLTSSNGQVVANADGTYTIIPAANTNGLVTLSYRVTDGTSTPVAATRSFTLAAVNDAPELAAALADQTFERGAFTFVVPAGTFADPEGDAIGYAATLADGSSLPAWLTFDAATRTFAGSPPASAVGSTITVRVTASDGTLSGFDDFTLTIAPKTVDTILDTQGGELETTVAGLGEIDQITASAGHASAIVKLTDGGKADLSAKLAVGASVYASNAGNHIVAGAFDDALFGGDGNDRLDGGAGKDTLAGGKGADNYSVDDAGDVVTELAGEGADIVYASVDWTMTAGSAIEQLRANYGAAASGLTLTGNALDNLIMGGDAADVLSGGEGADRLIGGLGADMMDGGSGNDSYYVDDAGDSVVELVNGGTDVVYASVDWTLTAGAHVEQLRANYGAATQGISLTGNALNNFILGGAQADTLDGGDGADRLDGGLGADTMIGGMGNDSFYVDDAGDSVVEFVNGGTDVVYASVSWTMGDGFSIEQLRANYGAGATGITLTGNELANQLFGGAQNDVLYGGGGNDRLTGGLGADEMHGGEGNDTYYVDDSGDRAIETAGEGTDTVYASTSWTITENSSIEMLRAAYATGGPGLSLTGNELANSIFGGSGADTLDGGLGADILTGGSGADLFSFSTALGNGNIDRIIDFSAAEGDRLLLSTEVFTGLTIEESIDPSQFTANLSGKATSLEHRIIYETDTGKLFYDADGLGGDAAIQFAQLNNKATLTAGDIFFSA